jgi:hypothetical protein
MPILIPTHHPIGLEAYRTLDLGVTGQVVKAAQGQLYGWYIANNAGAARFVKVYDKATAPTQADTPVLTLELPASAAANAFTALGIAFHSGIALRATTAVADNDTGAPSANDLVVNVFYA